MLKWKPTINWLHLNSPKSCYTLECIFFCKKEDVRDESLDGYQQAQLKYCSIRSSTYNSVNCLRENELLNDVIFTDKCSVLLENYSKLSFHRKWEQPKLKGKPKHPVKAHIWAGISKRGPTERIMLEGIMDAVLCLRDSYQQTAAVHLNHIPKWSSLPAG